MDKYIGVKFIEAEVAWYSFHQIDGGTIITKQSYKNDNIPTSWSDGYKIIDDSGIAYWSPKEVFEKEYRIINGLTFGLAIEALKQGKKVARIGWNGKGMWLTLIHGFPVNGHLNPAIGIFDDRINEYSPNFTFEVQETNPDGTLNITQGNPGQMLPYIVMKTAGESKYWGEGYSDYVPWLASQTDVLAEDWCIVE